jgi:hypothetical protein
VFKFSVFGVFDLGDTCAVTFLICFFDTCGVSFFFFF